jgi:zinc transporter, ZIP family
MDIIESTTWNAVFNIGLLSLVAGLGTSVGGLLAVIRRPGRRSFGFLMGVTAGVMLSLAFLELVNRAWEEAGYLTATVGFAAGALFMFLLDFLAPHMRFGETEVRSRKRHRRPDPCDCPEEPRPRQRGRWGRMGRGFRRRNHITDPKLLRTGILLAVGITIHNIPEGIAVGAGYMHAPEFGLFIAMAIMLHNIPEGLATALPLCKSGVCRWDSFRAAALSGLSEPVGAVAAALFLTSFTHLVPGALAFAGGVMVFITLDELLPTAREHGHEHYTALGIIFGSIFVFLLSGVFGV